jgi:putative ABC transport system permease protein
MANIDSVWQDLRFGARQLRLNPGFAAVSILSLALGIGANTSIFQLIDAVRLRSLPVSRAEELAEIAIADRRNSSGNFTGRHSQLTYAQWEQIRDRAEGFCSLMAWGDQRFDLSQTGA